MTSVGCDMKRLFEYFVLRMTSGWVSCGWAETKGDCKMPGFRDHVLPLGNPNVGRSDVARPQRKAVRVFSRPAFSFWAKACFLGGLREEVGNRIVSAFTVSSTWTECGVITNATEDFAAQGALCALVEEGDASQSKRGELGPPTKQAPAPGT